VKRSGPAADILVALDGSQLSQAALSAAIRLGTRLGSRIHVLHVVPRLEEYARHKELLVPLMNELAGVGKSILEEGGAAVSAAGLPHVTSLSSGHPAGEIALYARQKAVDLIVLGSRGLNPEGAELLGSVSYQVAMRAPCSVLVARAPDPFPRVLLAVDGSDDSRKAASFIEQMGTELVSLVTLTFIVPSRPEGAFTLAATPADPFLLEEEKRLRDGGLVVVREVRHGHPAEVIVKASERHTLVALGARGRSELALDYVGGVADKVLRNSRASTLVVR
jgi:nucleotide-binding universal stress UspA family protein